VLPEVAAEQAAATSHVTLQSKIAKAVNIRTAPFPRKNN
jgi:hypothetical protein